jgi:hypothetical protein
LNQHLAPDVSSMGVWMRKSTWRAPRPAGPSGPDGPGEMAPAAALVIDPGHAVLIASGAVFTEPVN